MRTVLALLVAVAMPLAAYPQEYAPPAPPQQYQPAPGYMPRPGYASQRHLGFFIRPELGVGYVSSKASEGGATLKISGSGATLGLAVGGAVSENFIVGGHVWEIIASSPEVEASAGGLSASGTADGTSALVGYGLLLNWYFMPSNAYLALTPSLTRLVAENDGSTGRSEWGVGLRAAVGKEWWVSNSWGLGLAASLAVSSNEDAGPGAPTFTSTGFGLTFSATYN